jgi:hypothetical protein
MANASESQISIQVNLLDARATFILIDQNLWRVTIIVRGNKKSIIQQLEIQSSDMIRTVIPGFIHRLLKGEIKLDDKQLPILQESNNGRGP